MADDWQIGDRALCVANEIEGFGRTDRIKVGRVYVVEGLYVSQHPRCLGLLALIVQGVRGDKYPGIHHGCFRKLRDHTPDEEDAETIRLMSGAPVGEPVA